MIDLTQIFSELGIVSGNTNSNNQFEFYGNIEFDDGTITTNQYEFFKKIGMSRYEFFKQYGGEKEFYQNIQELGGSELNPNIYNYKTFYQNAGEYFGSSGPIISLTDLVAYYKLDGNGDDFYGNYDLTISNPAIIDDIDGKFDGGAYFPADNNNGATGNSTMSINGNLDNLRMPFSVSMWVKPTANLSFLFTINGESADGGKGVSAYMAAAGQIVLEYHNGGPNGLPSRKTFATSSGLLTPNVWSHVVIYVEDINTNKVYVNGNEINIQYSNGEATGVVWGDNSSIGSRLNYLGHQVSKDLYMDDVSIWKRELTENEVIKLYGDSPLDNSTP